MLRRLAAVVACAALLGTVACSEGGPAGQYVGNGGMAATGGAVGTGGEPMPTTCQVPIAPDGYCVAGNRILDAYNQPHQFRGINRPSLEWVSVGERLSTGDFGNMAAWGANVVRIPLNQQFWLTDLNGYQGRIDQTISWARGVGLDVILDLHWSTQGGLVAAEQQDMPDVDSRTFWAQVAARYQFDGRIIFELYNEPRNVRWSLWLAGGAHPTGGWITVGMQELYDTVRATGAQNLVLIGGLDWAYSLSGVPSNRVVGYNIAYTSHLYPYVGKMPDTWYENWAFILGSDPVVVTEFGPVADGATDLAYPPAVVDYANANGVGWVAWAWYNFGDNGFFTAFEPASNTYALTPYGQYVQAALAQP